jgi:hypothetical protein
VANIAKRGAQNQPSQTPPVEGDKYTVLLLDEDQLDRFLNRPSLKSISSHLTRTVDVWPRGHRARVWATAAAVAVLAVTVVWLRAAGDPKAPVSTHAPVRKIVNGPPVSTGASFSVNVTSFSRDAEARVMAGKLTKAGLPSFAWRLNGSFRDVLVGPFVSIDEAESAQRQVARLGYARTRLHVDERLRSADDVAAVGQSKGNPAVVLVAAPGRMAVAFELSEEPQEVSGRRLDSTTFAVTASAGPTIDAQEWNAPSDVQLVKHVSVAADPRGLQGLQAFVTVAENAVATVRLQGTRVYVDVSRAQLDFDEQPAASVPAPVQSAPASAPAPVAVPPARALAVPRTAAPAQTTQSTPSPAGPRTGTASPGDVNQYRQAIGPVFARFEEIQPFLRSAVSTPTPEVLAAIAGTFAELEQTVHAADVPRAAQGAHGLLLSAVQLARGAVAPNFGGDRMSQVREAMAQFQAAKAQLR